jgi:hypothetical protein
MRAARLALLLWLPMMAGGAHAACEQRVERMEFAAIEKPVGPVLRDSELRSVVVDPSVGTSVGRDSVITVDFEYRAVGFGTAQFWLSVEFRIGPIYRVFDAGGRDPTIPMEFAAGRVRMCMPLAGLYGADALSVSWPLEMRVVMRKGNLPVSLEVASSPGFKLNVADIPPAALEKQAKAAPPEVDSALIEAYDHVDMHRAMYELCREKFPNIHGRLIPAYREWESRHDDDLDFISRLMFEQLSEQYAGRVHIATAILDGAHRDMLDQLASGSVDSLKFRCVTFVAALRTGEFSGARFLPVIRAWYEKKK